MSRHDLTDREWNAIRPLLPAERSGRPGRPWVDHRMVINGILWIVATGAPWRDLDSQFGSWKTVYNRFRRWQKEGLWERLMLKRLRNLERQGRIDRTLWCVDGSVVRAHRCASGALPKSDENDAKNALGRSQGGYSTKLHLLTDSRGRVLSATATPGQRNESTEFENLFSQCPLSLHLRSKRPEAVAGDKGYSSKAIRDWLRSREIKDTIPTRINEAANPRFARKRYRRRNIVERVIGWLKESRRIATRYDKLIDSYLCFIQIAAWRLMMKSN